ncbi:MAG: PEGA domain-containing protein, partial [Prevotellaceae bacterium]|nr:PEGA domain-containing protein [Prevotellaceae bacterium]
MRTAKHKAYKQWLFALAMMLTAGASVNAQMSVTKFEKTTDQEARIGSPRTNTNDGKLYALIKITTDLTCTDFVNFNFGGVGYGDIDCEKGTWVYAPAGARRISINHKLAGSLENHDLPMTLEAGTVYVMELASGRQHTYLEHTSNIGYVTFEGHVIGATLKINNETEIMADAYWRKNLPAGAYDYEISAPNYETERGKVTVRGEEKTPVNIKMRSSLGEVRITSTPEDGASILIDDKMQDGKTTPATIELNKGKYSITVTKKFYKLDKQEVQVKAGAQTQLNVELKPNFAVVSVHSADNGKIFIDDNFVANGSWQDRLAAGPHRLRV